MGVEDFRKTKVYVLAYKLAMDIFEVTKSFPQEEKYSLTNQIRRSSRSVCANIGEAYRKKLYQAHFISKTTDADAENTETVIWLDFSYSCKYMSQDSYQDFCNRNAQIGKLLHHMIANPHL